MPSSATRLVSSGLRAVLAWPCFLRAVLARSGLCGGVLARLLAVIVLAGVFGVSGCGARTASEAVLPTQSYSIVVKATSTNLAGNVVEHTVGVTLSVE